MSDNTNDDKPIHSTTTKVKKKIKRRREPKSNDNNENQNSLLISKSSSERVASSSPAVSARLKTSATQSNLKLQQSTQYEEIPDFLCESELKDVHTLPKTSINSVNLPSIPTTPSKRNTDTREASQEVSSAIGGNTKFKRFLPFQKSKRNHDKTTTNTSTQNNRGLASSTLFEDNEQFEKVIEKLPPAKIPNKSSPAAQKQLGRLASVASVDTNYEELPEEELNLADEDNIAIEQVRKQNLAQFEKFENNINNNNNNDISNKNIPHLDIPEQFDAWNDESLTLSARKRIAREKMDELERKDIQNSSTTSTKPSHTAQNHIYRAKSHKKHDAHTASQQSSSSSGIEHAQSANLGSALHSPNSTAQQIQAVLRHLNGLYANELQTLSSLDVLRCVVKALLQTQHNVEHTKTTLLAIGDSLANEAAHLERSSHRATSSPRAVNAGTLFGGDVLPGFHDHSQRVDIDQHAHDDNSVVSSESEEARDVSADETTLLTLPFRAHSTIVSLLPQTSVSAFACVSKQCSKISKRIQRRVAGITWELDSSFKTSDTIKCQAHAKENAIKAKELIVKPVLDIALSATITSVISLNQLNRLVLYDFERSGPDSPSLGSYLALKHLGSLSNLKTLELLQLKTGAFLLHAKWPNKLSRIAISGTQGGGRALSQGGAAECVADLIQSNHETLRVLRVRRLTGIDVVAVAQPIAFSALETLDIDLWPLTFIAGLGVAPPDKDMATKHALASLLHHDKPLRTALMHAERSGYYWGNVPRVDIDQSLSLQPLGTFLVRFSERTHQLVVSCHDPYLSRVRHVLVSATARGICWENADDTATGVYSSLDKLLEDYPDTYCRAQRRTFCESWAPPGTWFTGGDESSSESESDEPYGSVSMALRRVRERLNEQSDGAFSDSEVDDHPARHSSVKHLSSLACDSDSNQE